MKKLLIGALVCLNLALVLVLVQSINEPAAFAQARGNADYMMVTGRDGNQDAVFVFDVVSQKLVAFEPDANKNYRLRTLAGRTVKGDFGTRD